MGKVQECLTTLAHSLGECIDDLHCVAVSEDSPTKVPPEIDAGIRGRRIPIVAVMASRTGRAVFRARSQSLNVAGVAVAKTVPNPVQSGKPRPRVPRPRNTPRLQPRR